MFYNNKKKHKSLKEKNLVFSLFSNGVVSNVDDSVANANCCKSVYNLDYNDGALKTGLGINRLELPTSLENPSETYTYDFSNLADITDLMFDRWYSSELGGYYYQIQIVDSNNKIWTIPLFDEDGNFIYLVSTRLSHAPSYSCVYRTGNIDSTLYFSQDGMLTLSISSETLSSNVPEMISSVVHYGKFFGITKQNNKLVYTSNLNLTEWSSSNTSVIEFLDNRGAFKKLVSFNDYVYLFRENGITKISLYSTSGSDFSFTHLYQSSSKIYENSICVCGSKILFVARDGLYEFNGNSVRKILQKDDVYFKNLENKNCTSAFLDGKYYLSTKCDFADGKNIGCESGNFVNNALFEIDVESEKVNVLRGVDIRKLMPIDCPYFSKLCACFYNLNKKVIGEISRSGKDFETVIEKSWKSFETDFGFQGKRKHIKRLLIKSLYDCKVKIESDEESKEYDILGCQNEQKMPINVSGNEFSVEFVSNNQNCKICKPMFVFDVVS